jgi:hypothetical protein
VITSMKVFVHIGLPKTGTSYLQGILWGQRDQLRAAGLFVPGRKRRDHLWSSMVVRDDPNVTRRHPDAAAAWDVVRRDVAGQASDAIISHEFFCSASAEQAQRMVADLAPAEVHVVVTARDPLGIFTSSWQESLKNKGTQPMANYAREVSDDPTVVWNWRALDLALVLERWGSAVPPERLHVLTSAPGSQRPELWAKLCSVIGLDPAVADTSGVFPNESMGVVEAETLRRLNQRLRGFDGARDRGVWIRTFLADKRLVPRGGEKFWPADDQVADCRSRGEAAAVAVHAGGFDLVGSLDDLRVPVDLPARRQPSSVTDAEVADVALDLAAQLLGDVRDRSTAPTPAPAPRRWRKP